MPSRGTLVTERERERSGGGGVVCGRVVRERTLVAKELDGKRRMRATFDGNKRDI
jgi:hypothetical protein